MDASDSLTLSEPAIPQRGAFQVACGPSIQPVQLRDLGEMGVGVGNGSGVRIFNNSPSNSHAHWGWKPTSLEMICIDFLRLVPDRNSD